MSYNSNLDDKQNAKNAGPGTDVCSVEGIPVKGDAGGTPTVLTIGPFYVGGEAPALAAGGGQG
jgi:hypothetical protein